MSWWVYLEDRSQEPWCSYNQAKPWEPDFEGDERCTRPCYPSVELANTHSEGGTYVWGGTTQAELNITYNYGKLYYLTLDRDQGLRVLNDKRAGDVLELLENAVNQLGTNPMTEDYWAPTPGNAGKALSTLLDWARQHPDAIFTVS